MVCFGELCNSQWNGSNSHTDIFQHKVYRGNYDYDTNPIQFLRPHVVLWILYMIIYTFLLVLIPCTWISFIWDQIIDPEFDLEHIEQPENRLIKAFYKASGAINTSFIYRNLIFVFIGVMTMLSSVLDLVITPCMLENPRVRSQNLN